MSSDRRRQALRRPLSGDFSGEDAQQVEETAKAGTFRRRRVHCVEHWLKVGAITQAEYEAAERFCLDYHHAQMLPHFATAQLVRVDHGGEEPSWRLDRRKAASAAVQAALRLAGPRGRGPLECIVGQGMSLADDCHAPGTSVRAGEVRAVVIAILGILGGHYGFTKANTE